MKRRATCHPELPYFAKGFCRLCWQRNYNKRYKKPFWRQTPEQHAKALARKRQWYRENRELKRQRDKAYVAAVKADPVRHLNRLARDRKRYLDRNYGITPELYDQMVIAQLGLCALCGKQPTKRGLDVDHSHESGKLRGLLCYRCNATVIAIVEDAALVEKAKTYLALYENEKAPVDNLEPSEIVTVMQESSNEQDENN